MNVNVVFDACPVVLRVLFTLSSPNARWSFLKTSFYA